MASSSPEASALAPGAVVLVIGGRGFVGSHIVRRLLDRGFRPHVFGPEMAEDLLGDLAGGFGETIGSVEDRDAVVNAIRASGATGLVTTAAHSAGRQGLMRSGEAEMDRALAVNVLGFRHVLEAALECGLARVVWTSSTVVYGPSERYTVQPVDEEAETAPRTVYGLTKELAERVAAFYRNRHGLDLTGLRLPLVLGPGLWYQGAASAIVGLIRAAAPGARYRVSFHDEPIDLMHVTDVAEAMVAALVRRGPFAAVYNINGFTARLSDLARAVEARVPGYRVATEVERPALLFPLVSDARFRRDLGFAPRYDLGALVDDMLKAREEAA
ncbi:MAG: NAD(P)-dependent oxidoreductase [Pseudomonadota bacterium]|nr:NAD(P)-dependent oxidoreductase [Pseudomonadota bacterium]